MSNVDTTESTSLFDGGADLSGDYKWIGGVLAPNGKIYGIPDDSTSVLCIDPSNNTTSRFGSLSGTGKWVGGVLAPNGKIYGIPYNSTTVLCIDFPAEFCRVEVYVNNRQFICDDGMGKVRLQTRQILQYPELNVGVISRYGRTKMKQVSVDSVEI